MFKHIWDYSWLNKLRLIQVIILYFTSLFLRVFLFLLEALSSAVLCPFVHLLYDASNHTLLCSVGLYVKYYPLLHPTPKYFANSHYEVKIFDNTQSHHVNEKNLAWALKSYHPQTLYHPQMCRYNLVLFPLISFPLSVHTETMNFLWEGLPANPSALQCCPHSCPHGRSGGQHCAPALLLSMESKVYRAWVGPISCLSRCQPKIRLGSARHVCSNCQLGSTPGVSCFKITQKLSRAYFKTLWNKFNVELKHLTAALLPQFK